MTTKALPAVQRASHRARARVSVTVEYLRQLGHARIHIADLCPLNSPNLNPVDYKIWDSLQERVGCIRSAYAMSMT